MNPFVFAGSLAVLSLAMVFAMVQYSRAYLDERDRTPERERWGVIYLMLWAAILALLVVFADRFDVMMVVVPAAWFAVHGLILRFGAALREAVLEDRRRAALEPVVELDEEEPEEPEAPPPPPPTFAQKLLSILRWIVSIVAVLIVIAIGEAIPFLRRIDAAVAPHKIALQIFLGILLAAGFAMFMGGIIHMVLKSRSCEDGELTFAEVQRAWHEGTWRDTVRMRRFFLIAGGVLLAVMSGASLAILTATPGIKLLVIIAVTYAAIRMFFARQS